jgi:hypothetical protein
MPARNKERHRTERIGWLCAAVLGANDGILSTSSLVLGVAVAVPHVQACRSTAPVPPPDKSPAWAALDRNFPSPSRRESGRIILPVLRTVQKCGGKDHLALRSKECALQV